MDQQRRKLWSVMSVVSLAPTKWCLTNMCDHMEEPASLSALNVSFPPGTNRRSLGTFESIQERNLTGVRSAVMHVLILQDWRYEELLSKILIEGLGIWFFDVQFCGCFQFILSLYFSIIWEFTWRNASISAQNVATNANGSTSWSITWQNIQVAMNVLYSPTLNVKFLYTLMFILLSNRC